MKMSDVKVEHHLDSSMIWWFYITAVIKPNNNYIAQRIKKNIKL